MRIMVKGGVWKNTEDEILKAAVMKYGKNQWARISSLLVRKSAKQCKARWYEWLDPSIKKTEWSREEEEKLLHLAKIMPNQWKSIAPIVGRTASQCLEHYERLLDAAQTKDENYNEEADPRRLRPGEIDPNPESKPARPDPVDMDEDEKEMLSEARARLANTKGKKAKRKAREKQLEEARRLTSLQKRRELKAAGIEIPKLRKKVRGIDYNREIPFQKKPPPGFYDVNWEEANKQEPFKKVMLSDLEGKRRRDEEEEKVKQDSKKQKLKEKKNLPAAIMQINKLNDPDVAAQRTKLLLPEPQLSEKELEELAKADATEIDIAEALLESGSSITRSLLPSYSASPSPAKFQQQPIRTPLAMRTPTKEDNLMKEAQNLIALTNTETPLHGGENPELHDSDFSRAMPQRRDVRTPNVFATPLRTPAGAIATPGRSVRDSMNINDQEAMTEDEKEQRKRLQEHKSRLRDALKNLPAPQFEYQLQLPELPSEETDEIEDKQVQEEDASDALRRREQLAEQRRQMMLRLRSQVLKRNLPRPYLVTKSFADYKSKNPNPELQQAEDMLRQEVVKFITYEAGQYPFKQSRIPSLPGLEDDVTEEELKQAQSLLEDEMLHLEQSGLAPPISEEEYERIWNECHEDFIFLPSSKTYGRASHLDKKHKVESLEKEFEMLKAQVGKEASKAKKLEKKIDTYNGGYQKRAATLLRQIQDLNLQIDQKATELACFTKLQEFESMAIPSRIQALQKLVAIQQENEAELQKQYYNLYSMKQDLMSIPTPVH